MNQLDGQSTSEVRSYIAMYILIPLYRDLFNHLLDRIEVLEKRTSYLESVSGDKKLDQVKIPHPEKTITRDQVAEAKMILNALDSIRQYIQGNMLGQSENTGKNEIPDDADPPHAYK